MPRKKNVSGQNSQQSATRRSTRQAASRDKSEDDVPEVFQDMLIEAYKNNPDDFAPNPRPPKRRKVNVDEDEQPQIVHRPKQSITPSPPSPVIHVETPPSLPPPERAQQIVFNNDFTDDDDDSDVSFEDVEISRAATPVSDGEIDAPRNKTLQLDLSSSSKAPQNKQSPRTKTKPLTKLERAHRLNVHKWHLLCLLLHLETVNRWCDDERIQRIFKPLVSRGLSNRLHLPDTRTQTERKFSFEEAIKEICHLWKLTFKITDEGMRKARWRDQLDMASEVENAPDPIDFDDFQAAAKRCTGSRDLGTQFFCALMRCLAVDTRLVCSLQVLPFARDTTTTSTPQKAAPTYITAGTQDFGTRATTPRFKKKRIVDSPYPIWWIEVFSPSISAWLPLDPLVRNTVNKPRTGFEPPASDPLNTMSYVIAFEEDGYAKDVTRRYTSYYNAKTRRSRVEVTKGGSEWFSSIMQHFAKHHFDRHDREVIEDAELRRRVAQEGMPKNVQDLKDHPIYVLERHLRHNEVIEPKRECGKFSVGSGKNARLESVYRREHVHACRSSEGWYRRGRDIQPGQQPLKRAVPRKKRATSLRLDDGEGDEEDDSVPLYAEFQTELYIPPPVVDGKVPRNGFGNLDVYVPSMIPAGGVHIRHTLAKQAAAVLKIDAADAVTGFIFKGRQGTAVVDGVVVDAHNTAVMLATIQGLEDQLEEDINAQRSAIIFSVWKKMHAVLKVRQRIQEDYGERAGIDMDSRNDDRDEHSDDDDSTYDDDADGGGFMPDVIGEATVESRAEEAENLKILRDRAPVILPAPITKQRPVVVRSLHELPKKRTAIMFQNSEDDLFGDNEDVEPGAFMQEATDDNDAVEGGGFVVDKPSDVHQHSGDTNLAQDEDLEGGFVQEDSAAEGGGFLAEDNGADGGGFLPEDDTAGGFLPEDDSQQPPNTNHANQAVPSVPTLTLNESSNPPISSTQSTTSTVASRSRTSRRMQTHPVQNNEKDNHSNLVAADDYDDNHSLPSHDPEEDDMEMQWVEDAFED